MHVFQFSARIKFDRSTINIGGKPTRICRVIILSTMPEDTGLWIFNSLRGRDIREVFHTKVTIGNKLSKLILSMKILAN